MDEYTSAMFDKLRIEIRDLREELHPELKFIREMEEAERQKRFSNSGHPWAAQILAMETYRQGAAEAQGGAQSISGRIGGPLGTTALDAPAGSISPTTSGEEGGR